MVIKSYIEKLFKGNLPLPTFNDYLKLIQFWIDQEDKWFYFVTDRVKSSSSGERDVPAPMHQITLAKAYSSEKNYYVETRIVGQISDVIFNPPSLMLKNAIEIMVEIDYDRNSKKLLSNKERKRYGLVFSQITYYEPIEGKKIFLETDERVNK